MTKNSIEKDVVLKRVLQNDLGDFDVFLHAVKNLLTSPEKFGLEAG